MITDPSSRNVQEVLAANLRRLRIARSLSLSELARATRLSKATLSSVESAHSNPTVGTIASLAAALRVSLGELLEPPAVATVRVVRAEHERAKAVVSARERELDAFPAAETATLSEIALPARYVHEPPLHEDGCTGHVYVLQGKLIAGPVEVVTELAAGDYASFPIDVPHVFETRRQPARLLLLARAPR